MRTKGFVLLLAVAVIGAVMTTGCPPGAWPRPPSQRQTFLAAVRTYNATMNVLAELRRAGVIDVEAAVRIERARKIADMALNAWHGALVTGRPTSTAIGDFNAALRQLIAVQAAAERKRKGGLQTRPTAFGASTGDDHAP